MPPFSDVFLRHSKFTLDGIVPHVPILHANYYLGSHTRFHANIKIYFAENKWPVFNY